MERVTPHDMVKFQARTHLTCKTLNLKKKRKEKIQKPRLRREWFYVLVSNEEAHYYTLFQFEVLPRQNSIPWQTGFPLAFWESLKSQ